MRQILNEAAYYNLKTEKKMEKIMGTLGKKILAANKHEELVNQYKMLSTDEERIIFTLNIMSEYGIIPLVCEDVKNAKESERLREQGNKIFVSIPLTNLTCVEALKLYTKSVAYAPCQSEQLSLAYANRSAILIKLHKYEECIQDIDRALTLAYPDNLRAKLYVRKVECLQALKDSNAEEVAKEAQQWLEKMSLNDSNRKKLNEKLTSIRRTPERCNSKKQNTTRHQTVPSLPKIKTVNPEVPCASNAIMVKYNEKYGRHVVAARKINPGEVIVVEKPYSLLLTPDNTHTHCSNCLEVSWANIPCNYCTYTMYCSEECRAAEWKQFHDVECSVFPSMLKMNFSKSDLLCLRLAIQAVRESPSIQELREELKEIDSCDDPRVKGFSKNRIFESNKYRSLLGLVTNTEKRSVQDLFARSVTASFTLYFLATCTDMFGSPLQQDLSTLVKNTDVTFVGGLILRHKQMIPCNFHSFSEERGLEAAERGVAVMPFCSLINHSCSSNILRHSKSNHIVIYTIYPIEKGEQVFFVHLFKSYNIYIKLYCSSVLKKIIFSKILDNYGEHYAITPRDSRQKELLKQYYFKCDCIACQENWPLFYNLKSFRSLVKNKGDENRINHALRKFNTYVNIAAEGKVSDKPYIRDDLLKMINVLYKLAPMPCEELNNVVETLKRVYDLSGNKFEIPEL
ncbi:protein-lysine N-methyltransferase SMYD4 isoform X2 [Calliopsis andreniformis]|uniref:protein-lysine N-methyltransferase SMYD4 isoform X2 n=1 Tax=Calliopsis andreniformis TaxID=337506 RepID=UPI003FCE739E